MISMTLLSIFCKCGKTADSSSGNGMEGLIIFFVTMIIFALLFLIWLKTPAGKDFLSED